MKFKGLSLRLKKAFELALSDQDLWDVGCDHGQLGIFAIKSRRFRNVHFVDPAVHRIQFLQNRIVENSARFHGKKVQDIDERIEGTLIFLGVGGTTIKTALEKVPQLNANRLILGPQKDLTEIEGLGFSHYQLIKSTQVIERGRSRLLYVFDRVVK